MQKKKLIANAFFFLIVVVVILIVVFQLNDINEIKNIIKNANISYILISLLLMFIHVFLTSISMYIIKTGLHANVLFVDVMFVGSSEYLFNAITPFSSGGQPVQAYYLKKLGATGDESASITISNFIVYQTTLTLFSTIGLILFFDRIYSVASNYMYIIIIGYIINTLLLLILVLVSTLKRVANILRQFIRLLGKIKFLNKKMMELEDKTFAFVEKFQKETKSLFKRKRVLLGTTTLRILDLMVFNAIPITVFYALGIHVSINDYLYIIMMSAFAQTFMIWVPTPGASGGVEWAYTILFTAFAQTQIIVASMLLWRFITYYIGIIIGLIAYLFIRRRSERV